ncbi:hypothetical protein [Actinomadura macrotermitis]|uniref:Uncharacterized protein n=1 Tax=Actinomadura macrotermitis TaxID=2585200 RepID=A0A7K0BQ70_9ACTN|nr:hypothetical protein [Actinomadura macrotermitis]MQY03348.1 hypothetical protein [Actinomadura macrotermitis]
MPMADPDPQPVFDENFVKGATFTEPSAEERARRPGRRERLRARRTARRYRAEADPARGSRTAVVQVIAGVLALLAISTALWWFNRPEPITALRPPAGGPPAPAAGDPFAGSPAARYATGDEGITLPVPEALNGLSAAQLGLAYEQIKKMLVAGALDTNTVFGGKNDTFRALVDPAQLPDLKRDLDNPAAKGARAWVTTFAPGSAVQVGTAIKVHGASSARPARRQGRNGVLVKTDHNFVYAVREKPGSQQVLRVVQRWANEYFVYRDGATVKVWITRADSAAAPTSCQYGDALIHPDFTASGQGGQTTDPYNLSKPIDTAAGCQTALRT